MRAPFPPRQALGLGFALVLASLGSGAAQALDDPQALIRALYASERAPDTPALADHYLAADLARPYKRDLKLTSEVGVIDFDWRYDAQDTQIADLQITPLADPAQTPKAPAMASVEARFTNYGHPTRIRYTLCLSKAGWRIADAAGDGGGQPWSLRDLFNLKSEVRCNP